MTLVLNWSYSTLSSWEVRQLTIADTTEEFAQFLDRLSLKLFSSTVSVLLVFVPSCINRRYKDKCSTFSVTEHQWLTNKCSAATVWWPSFVTGCLAAGKLMVTQSPRGSQGQSFPWVPPIFAVKTHDNIVKDIFFQTGWNSIYMRNFSGTCTILNKLPKFAVFHYYKTSPR